MIPEITRFTCKYILISALLALLAVPYASAQTADEAAARVLEIGQAIDNADADAFSRLVDMDAVLNNALDVFVQEASKAENSKRLPPMLAIILPQLTAGKEQSPVRDLLLGEAKNFVLAGISSGAFAGQKPDLSHVEGLLVPLFANASMGRKEIRELGTPRQIENGWIVPFVIYDHDNEYEYPIRGRLQYGENGLRLTGVENMRQLIYQIGEESSVNQ